MEHKYLVLAVAEKAKELWFPKLAIRHKVDSKLMLLINWLFNFFKPKDQKDWFLYKFTTVIMYTIYPSASKKKGEKSNKIGISTLLHELKHMWQAKKYTVPLFMFLYLWPLSQGSLIILTCWLPLLWVESYAFVYILIWFLVGALHFIPKLPDPWREKFELEAYTITLYLYYLRHKTIPDKLIEHYVSLFTNMSYYQMSFSKNRIRNKLLKIRTGIKHSLNPVKDDQIIQLYQAIKERIK